jgi:hypothetical protein
MNENTLITPRDMSDVLVVFHPFFPPAVLCCFVAFPFEEPFEKKKGAHIYLWNISSKEKKT